MNFDKNSCRKTENDSWFGLLEIVHSALTEEGKRSLWVWSSSFDNKLYDSDGAGKDAVSMREYFLFIYLLQVVYF